MSASLKDGTRQETDSDRNPGTAAALTPRVGGSDKGRDDGMSHAGPDESSGAFPEGWRLTRESWSFYRQFFARMGRPAHEDEYVSILEQIRRGAEQLDRYRFRVDLADGTKLVVRGGFLRLSGVEPADWAPFQPALPRPDPRGTALSRGPPTKTPPAKVASETAVEQPPIRKRPLTASTLTLGNPAAAQALAERMRRFGVPAPLQSGGPSP